MTAYIVVTREEYEDNAENVAVFLDENKAIAFAEELAKKSNMVRREESLYLQHPEFICWYAGADIIVVQPLEIIE